MCTPESRSVRLTLGGSSSVCCLFVVGRFWCYPVPTASGLSGGRPGVSCTARLAAPLFDLVHLGGPSHYSGNNPIGFEHCGAHFFDLGGPSHYSGNYPIGFEHCGLLLRVSVRAYPRAQCIRYVKSTARAVQVTTVVVCCFLDVRA